MIWTNWNHRTVLVRTQALSDEYLVRCLTPSRSGRIKSQKNDIMPTIFKTKLRRSDPRAVNAMAKYAVAKNLSFGSPSTGSAAASTSTRNSNIQISSKKSARLLATAIYYSLKQVRSTDYCTKTMLGPTSLIAGIAAAVADGAAAASRPS